MTNPVALALLLLVQAPQLPEHLREGSAQLSRGAVPEAIATFDALVRDDPEDGEAWYFLGLAHHTAGDHHRAIRGHLMASQLVRRGHPFRPNAMYNTACAYALTDRPERALQWLHRARNAGFANVALVKSDADLESLRGDPRLATFQQGVPTAAVESAATVASVTEVLPGGTGGVELGLDGTLYVASFGSEVWRIRPDGTRDVLASGFQQAADCTLDADGNLLQVDHGGNRVVRIAPDGTTTDLGIQGVNLPVGIDTAPDGSLFLTSFRDDAIVHVAPDGTSRRLAARGLLNGPNGIAYAGELGLFVVNFRDGAVLQLDPGSGVVRFVCELPGDGNGHVAWTGEELFVTARKGHRVYRVLPDGTFAPVAGSGTQGTRDGGAATSRLSLPNGIAVSPDGGTIYVNDALGGGESLVRSITPSASGG